MPIIIANQEADMKKTAVQGQLRQITYILNTQSNKRLVEWLKPQY
jgi:hypothetical protein